MSIAATMVWEGRTTGADTNGGGFKPGASGTDWSQQNAAQYAVADGVCAVSNTITSATANFGTDVVGNPVYVAGGTGSIVGVWREIVSRTNSTTIVVDASTGLSVSTGCTLNIGGAILSPGIIAASKTANNRVWIKGGTYTISSATANVANGKVSDSVGGTTGTGICRWEGYNVTRGDKPTGANRPILQSSVASITIFAVLAGAVEIDSITVDGNNQTANRGFDRTGVRGATLRCTAKNCTSPGFDDTAGTGEALWYRCDATGCSSALGAFTSAGSGTWYQCEAWANTTVGFTVSAGSLHTFTFCTSALNTGASSDGFNAGGRQSVFIGCVTYQNGRHGFNLGGGGSIIAQHCIAEGRGSGTEYGFTATAGVVQGVLLVNCAGYNNTTGNVNTTQITTATIGFIALTSSPFTNPGSYDFSLNNTAGGGAACRAAGLATMPHSTQTGYPDIGAVQHQDSAVAGEGSGYGGLLTMNPMVVSVY